MRRRRLLAAAGSGLAATLAGCSSLSDRGGGDAESLPPYARFRPADAPTGFVFVDVGRLTDQGLLGGTDTETPTPTPTPTESAGSDPASALLSAPVTAGLLTAFLAFGFAVGGYGDAGDRLTAAVGSETDDGTTVRQLTFGAETVVATGSFKPAAFTDALPEGFESVADREGFTASVAADGTGAAAVSESAVVLATGAFGDDRADGDGDGDDSSEDGESDGDSDDGNGAPTARAAVRRVVDARVGAADRLADRGPDAAWVLGRAGSHDFVLAGETTSLTAGGDDSYDPLAGTPLAGVQTRLLVAGASVSVADGEATSATADTALVVAPDTVTESALAAAYDDSDANVTVRVTTAAGDEDAGDEDGAGGDGAGDEDAGDDLGQRVHVTGEFGGGFSRL